MSGSAPSPRYADDEPQDARPIAPDVVDATDADTADTIDAIEDAHPEGSEPQPVRVLLSLVSDTGLNLLLSSIFSFMTVGWIALIIFIAGHPIPATCFTLIALAMGAMYFSGARHADDPMHYVEVGPTRLRLIGGYPAVRDYDRSEVRAVEVQDESVTIWGHYDVLVERKIGPRRARRLRKALEHYNWLE